MRNLIILFLIFIVPTNALGLIEVDITRGNLNPLPIAVSPLSIDDESKKSFEKTLKKKDIGSEISKVIEKNLKTSGLFNPLDKNAFLQAPDIAHLKPRFEDWNLIKAQALITGKVKNVDDKLRVEFRLWDVLAGKDPDGATLQPADRYSADMVWIGEEPLAHGRSYLLVSGSRSVPATVTNVRHRLDVVSGHESAARVLEMNDIGRVEVATDRPIPMDAYDRCRDTGGFLLVDRVTADTVAAGLVRHAMRRAFNVVPHEYDVTDQARTALMGHPSRVVWLTGLPGSGKSTIADSTVRRLHALGVHTYVLDGDNVRTGLNKDLGFTAEDRAENVRRVAEVAKLMSDAGLVVFVALVSPYRADREAAAALFDEGDFLEVFVDTPMEVCAERDPKGLYAKAAAGNLPNMTGMGQSYEAPENADVVLDGAGDLDTQVDTLARAVLGE